MNLRPYQQEAVESTLAFIAEGKGNPCIIAPTGSGKSLILAELTKRFNKPTLIVSHRKEILEQNEEKIRRIAPELKTGIYSASLNRKEIKPVTIAQIQSIAKRTNSNILDPFKLIIIDECFVKGTKIQTPFGDYSIERIQKGDVVYNALGVGRVLAISIRSTNEIVKVKLNNGTEIKTTHSHPFFTRSGWKESTKLEKGDVLFSLQDLRKLREENNSVHENGLAERTDYPSFDLCENEILLDILLQEERKCNVGSGSKGENVKNSQKNRTSTDNPRREWAWVNRATSILTRKITGGMGSRARSQNFEESKKRIPLSLQNRFSRAYENACNRIRRSFSFWEKKNSRSKEGRSIERIWVENIEIEKLTSPIIVYNLEVDGHPSYFANGVLVHNCHLIPKNDDTQYQRLLRACPDAAVVGLTATPMRLNDGAIIGEDQVFNAVSYEIKIKELVKDGFLCPLVGKSSVVQADLKDVQKRGGEYILEQARKAIDLDFLTLSAITECRKFASDRKAWIIFASGVEHAQKIGNAFGAYGITNRVITGETLPMLRDKYIKEFKNNEIKALINCEVLTTGFDSPNVDCIILLRATASSALYQQILGRGMRPYEWKANCLVLDFCGNLERHGPIDLIDYRDFIERKKGNGEAPGKICPECRSLVHASVRECLECGHQFPEPEKKHEAKASDLNPMGAEIARPKEYFVTDIEVKVVQSKKDETPMLMVIYICGFQQFREWVLFEHKGYGRIKACQWWQDRTMGDSVPITSEDAYSRFYREAWAVKSVWVKKESFNGANGKIAYIDKVLGVSKEAFLLKDKVKEDDLII